MSNLFSLIQKRRQEDETCAEMCTKIQKYSSQWSNPVFQRWKHTFGSIREERAKQSPAETERQAGRLLSGGGGGGGGTTTEKKNPWNFCEELEGYPDSCNSNRLDYSSLMTSFPALLLQSCSLQTWSGAAEQAGGSRVIAPPNTAVPQIYALS